MQGITVAHDILRSPSRASHRRPQLTRSTASFNLFPELPPIKTRSPPGLACSLSDSSSSSSGSDDSDDEFKVDLAPLCPPSPPSPVSPGGESDSASSSLSPHDTDEWEYFHDGYPPPPFFGEHQTPSPPTPRPQPDRLHGPPQYDHYGWSMNALSSLKTGLWFRRQCAWWSYEEDCRRLQGYCSQPSDDGISATIYFPPPPILPPSRRNPSWAGPNGIIRQPLTAHTPSAKRSPRSSPPPWRYNAYRSIFPRVGDLRDLRDPACATLDQAFVDWPSHRLSKFVYLNDMLFRAHTALAQSWTPDSPASVYSADSPCVQSEVLAAHNIPSISVGMLIGHPWELCWKVRWEMLGQRFPRALTSLEYSPHDSQSSEAQELPDRSASLMPNSEVALFDGVVAAQTGVIQEVKHSAEGILEDPPDSVWYQEQIAVRLPGPIPTSTSAQTPILTRPSTPFVACISSVSASEPLSLRPHTPEPIIRLPSPLLTHPTGYSADSELGLYLCADLALRNESKYESDANAAEVLFDIPRPPPRSGSPKFSFVAEEPESGLDETLHTCMM